jgi:GNAT superfamily N-acetyltransferase
VPERFVISWAAAHYADADWTQFADRWTASFYSKVDPVFGTAVITRVIPGTTPNPRRAFEADPGLLDRIPRVIFTEAGDLAPAVAELNPSQLLLLESVEVSDEWRGKGVGMRLAVEALRRLAVPGALAVCYPAPIHPQHGPGEMCSYESDDPEVRHADDEAVAKLRQAWERHDFSLLSEGVYVRRIVPSGN